MFDKYDIKTTWFIPGHSLETFPEECRMIADAGHEIGLHGYSHENPIAMTLEQQTAIMDKVSPPTTATSTSTSTSNANFSPFCASPSHSADKSPQCYKLITSFQGRPPRGMVAPWWESSQEGAELMLRYGLEYDHSFSHHDCQCYWLRTGDKWIPIDYSKQPDHWMKPLEGGAMTGLCEIPASWFVPKPAIF